MIQLHIFIYCYQQYYPSMFKCFIVVLSLITFDTVLLAQTKEYKLISKTEKADFNDILIVKTDSKLKIIDAYQYTLEWAEPPFSYDLYRAVKQGITLTNQLPVEKLGFTRTDYFKKSEREFNESGVISL